MGFKTLVSVQQLARSADDPSWRVFDCRHDLANPGIGERAYRDGHIRNAQFLHLDRDLSGPKTGHNGRHPLPDPAALAAKLARSGVSNGSQIVAYDDSGGMYAVRLWWLLRWLGHEKVAVLDGGLAAWQREGYPLTKETAAIEPAVFHWQVNDQPVDTGFLLAHLDDPRLLLIDSRGADRFRGENETIDPVAGHIPGARNRPFRDNLGADGRFKAPEQLRKEFDGLLRGHPTKDVVAYCGSGVSACHNLLALELAGFHGAKLYAGSWSEWCSDPKRPVAKEIGSS